MSSLPVWRLRHRIWLAVMAECFDRQKNHVITCVRHGLKIICVKFRYDRVKNVATGKFVWILIKFKMAAKLSYWPEIFAITINGTSHSMVRHWNFVANPHTSWDIRQKTFLIVIAPPIGKIAPTLVCTLLKGCSVTASSLVVICQKVDEIWAHFLFSCFTGKFDWLLCMDASDNHLKK